MNEHPNWLQLVKKRANQKPVDILVKNGTHKKTVNKFLMKLCALGMVMEKQFFTLFILALGVVQQSGARPVTLEFKNETGRSDEWLVIRLAYQGDSTRKAKQYEDRDFTSQPFTIEVGPDGYSDVITVVDKTGTEKSLVTLGADDTSAMFEVTLRDARGKKPLKLIRVDKKNKKKASAVVDGAPEVVL